MVPRRAPVLLLLLTACTPAPEQDMVARRDIAFAQNDWEEAPAEYRLTVRQGADDAATPARVAQTYATLGRADDAGS